MVAIAHPIYIYIPAASNGSPMDNPTLHIGLQTGSARYIMMSSVHVVYQLGLFPLDPRQWYVPGTMPG